MRLGICWQQKAMAQTGGRGDVRVHGVFKACKVPMGTEA